MSDKPPLHASDIITRFATVDLKSAAIATVGNQIVVTGGAIEKAHIRDVWAWSPYTGTWRQLPSMRVARKQHGCANLEGRLVVCGGRPPSHHAPPKISTAGSCTSFLYDGPVSKEPPMITSCEVRRYVATVSPSSSFPYVPSSLSNPMPRPSSMS